MTYNDLRRDPERCLAYRAARKPLPFGWWRKACTYSWHWRGQVLSANFYGIERRELNTDHCDRVTKRLSQ